MIKRIQELLTQMKNVLESGLQLLKDIPLKTLVEGFGLVVWTQRPCYQKTVIFLVGLRLAFYALRGVMSLLVIIHNRLYYLSDILDKVFRWIVEAPLPFGAWLGKIIEGIVRFIKEIRRDQ